MIAARGNDRKFLSISLYDPIATWQEIVKRSRLRESRSNEGRKKERKGERMIVPSSDDRWKDARPVSSDPVLRLTDENGFSHEALTHSSGGRAAPFSRVYGIWYGSRKIARDAFCRR